LLKVQLQRVGTFNEEAMMRASRMVALTFTLMLACVGPVVGQECESLRNAAPDDLTSFLNTAAPDQKNADCVTSAIRQLGARRHAPAVPTLVKFLDFRRPLDETEKRGAYPHLRGVWDMYPAVDALESMGVNALPALLDAIKADSSSLTAQENAIVAWMEIYRRSDEHPKAVALLKQAQKRATDTSTRQKLDWAIKKALTWCNPPEMLTCRQAAATGTHNVSASSN
jgi:hypothetical protein